MWFAELLDPGNPTYNAFEALRLHGALDARVLQRVLDEIVRRHEILRTAFRAVDGEPSQIVLPPAPFPLEVVDRSALAPDDEDLAAMCEAFVRRPHSFADGTLARALLVTLAPDESVLVFAMHHIVRDGWAIGVFLREIGELWDDVAAGRAPALPSLPIQYGDYAVWQRALHDGGAFDEQRAYWSERLAGAPLEIDAAPSTPRPAGGGGDGGLCRIDVSRDVLLGLRELASHERASLFMTLAAAFQTFVRRRAGVDDVLTGFPVAGRTVPETEPLMGCFINTAVLRTSFEPGDTFRHVLRRVRDDALAAYANQDYPFVRLVEDLRPPRRAGTNPIVQTMVTLVDRRRATLHVPGVRAERFPLRPGISKLDLTIEMAEHDGGLSCRLEYRTALFDQPTAAAALDEFGALLASVARDPDARAAGVRARSARAVPAHERAPLLATLDGPHLAVPDRCVDEIVRERALLRRDATAVVCGDERLTYGELNARSDALAQRLRRCGAGPDRVVVALLEPSASLVVAALAILKSGAAYLPVDPRYPPERLHAVLDAAEPAAAVADARHAPRLEARVRTLHVDGTGADEGTARDEELVASDAADAVRRSASDLAYVIFTSGSTGTPKGAAIEHRNLMSYLTAALRIYEITERDVLSQLASPSFDSSIKDIFGTLIAGATLVIASAEARVSPAEAMRACEAAGVTVFDASTAFWHVLVHEVAAGRTRVPPTIRLAIVGGEPMAPAAARTWCERTGVRLINAYGPTETTIAVTLHDVTDVDARATTVPVGRAIPNVRLYVLDDALEPVPRGEVGTLYIAGATVGRGYHRRPDLSANAFVPDVHRNDGSRMYATGDRARIDADGLLHIMGRSDGQVKVRGFRIETGDVEAALRRHPAVGNCAVVARDDARGERRLIAYVVRDDRTVTAAVLDAHVRALLPEYMIPQIAFVDALPVTVNGKIDHAALPAPDAAGSPRGEGHVAARDDAERTVAAVWEETLGVSAPGVHDNFFALGGHSLLAARVAARLESATGTRIPVASFFEAQTIGAMAALVRERRVRETPLLRQLQTGNGRPPFFFLHGDLEGGGLYCTRLAGGLGTDQPVFVVRPHERDDGNVPAIEDMAAERVRAIRAVAPRGPYLLGGYCINGAIAFEIARLLVDAGEDVSLVVLVDAPLGVRRRRALRTAIRALAAARRWPVERERSVYVGWENRFSYLDALPMHHRLALLARVALRNALKRIAPDAFVDAPGREGRQLEHGYGEAIARYRPRPYRGRMLFISSRLDASATHRLPQDWRNVAPRTTVHVVPATHQSLVRDHAHAIGARIREEIDALSPSPYVAVTRSQNADGSTTSITSNSIRSFQTASHGSSAARSGADMI